MAQEDALELNDREIALASGLDPDAEDAAVVDVVEETRPSDDIPVGTDAEDVGTDAPETPETDAEPETWITDDVKALAGTYGLSDEELGELDNEVEFLRLARLLDKRGAAVAAGKSETPVAPEVKPETVPDAKTDDLPTIDPQKYIDAGYDDDTVALARVAAALQKQVQAIVPSFEKQQAAAAEAEARRVNEEFHRVADELGRYGKTDKMDAASDGKRQKLWEAAGAVANSIVLSGKPLPALKTILQRAELVAFGDEIMAERKAGLAKSVKAQSAKRRPVGRTTVASRKAVIGDTDDPVKALANHPDIAKFWDENTVS
jgi:hypothetical protein